MALATVRNVSLGPVNIDRAGRVLGAGRFGTADVDTSPARAHVEAGRLRVLEPRDDDHVSEEAAAAFAETARRIAEDDEPAAGEEAIGSDDAEVEPPAEPDTLETAEEAKPPRGRRSPNQEA